MLSATSPEAPVGAIPAGNTFNKDGVEFIVLDHSIRSTLVITKEFIAKDFYIHAARHCAEFTEQFRMRYGFKSETATMPLLTHEQYLLYADILFQYNPHFDWWLADRFTPNEKHLYDRADALLVSQYGYVKHGHICHTRNGIRPVFRMENETLVLKGASI